ncbi:DNA translocase FtsK [Aneurinibacillus soli]|uniref:DNA translocase SpoIIIE n=1 Tax=Aneurinibacillus soli TaxID=1500254 RepID=A0A0U4NGQ6_9BACL|nr:DNA translocase FtsK [Aneurinibacillus soli]PYE58192.1 DNA translocase FtsK [Aneurinibacillus soli]BAU27908.1 DNA translocase SpoIIIE [Aneurinibacillus soli]
MAGKRSVKKQGQAKRNLGETLRYELYGLSVIMVSLLVLLTFSNPSWFGRYVSWVFRIAAGSWDFLIPLVGIGTGVYVMVQRKWPNFFTQRWVGIFLLFFAVLIWNHMLLFEQMTAGGRFADQSVMGVTWEQLLKENAQISAGKPSTTDVGGGMLGALGYGLFSSGVGAVGTTLVVVFLVLIGLMLTFNISYVRILAAVRRLLGAGGVRVKEAGEDALTLLSERRERRQQEKDAQAAIEAEFADEDEDDGSIEDVKPGLFTRWMDKRRQREEAPAQPRKQGRARMERKKASEPAVLPDMDDFTEPKGEIIVDHFADRAYGEVDVPPSMPESEGKPEAMYTPAAEPTVQMEGSQMKVMLRERTKSETKEPPTQQTPVSEVPLAFEEAEQMNRLYAKPKLDLLDRGKGAKPSVSAKDAQHNAQKLVATLESFGVQAKVSRVQQGPTVTRYEIQPAIGVKVSKIVNLTDDIALALAARGIRMEAPIPGKSAIGIEVPNDEVAIVTLREVLESPEYQKSEDKLGIALGRDISGQPIIANLARMPHLLVAGATGSGKSVCINGIIMSILFKAKPSEVKLMMIDPKMVELNVYNGVPHLLSPVVTDPRRASMALKKVVQEMERRYELFAKAGTRDLERYNEQAHREGIQPLPLIVVIVDELADLMMVAPGDVEDAICRLAQMARAAGIHLIIATQRPSVDVITGVIKANIPSRIAFGVSAMADSRTILDMGGAEKLLGRGDMLFLPMGASKPVRIQGAFISDSEVERVVEYVKGQQEARYSPEMVPGEEAEAAYAEPEDDMYESAVELVREAQTASVSLIQRRLRVGYTRAARLIDMMEARGVVGPYEGSKPREVLIPRHDSQIS